jgi:hypothetical protein
LPKLGMPRPPTAIVSTPISIADRHDFANCYRWQGLSKVKPIPRFGRN